MIERCSPDRLDASEDGFGHSLCSELSGLNVLDMIQNEICDLERILFPPISHLLRSRCLQLLELVEMLFLITC